MAHPRSTFGASPSRGQYQQPGRAGSAVFTNAASLRLPGRDCGAFGFRQRAPINGGQIRIQDNGLSGAGGVERNSALTPIEAGFKSKRRTPGPAVWN